ncbi:MAG: TonB-dependent receptor domain-containing protein, partial [Terriglobales bacterium]
LYLYDSWEVRSGLWLVGGVNYSDIRYPRNFRNSPLLGGEADYQHLAPKAGLIWQLCTNTTLRAQYSQSLGGSSFDQSISLEPTLLAGLNQSFRSIIPESIIGAASAPRHDVVGASLEHVLPTSTYLLWEGEWLRSRVDQDFGAFVVAIAPPNTLVNLTQKSRYEELSFKATVGQLVGDWFAVGASYRLSNADLENRIPQLSPTAAGAFSNQEGLLHQAGLFAAFNHPSGVFGRAETWWYRQHNHGYAPDLPGDDFWQVNLKVGMRFWKRRAEASVSLLNATGQDYRLNPLNLYQELPRSRMVAASLRFSF